MPSLQKPSTYENNSNLSLCFPVPFLFLQHNLRQIHKNVEVSHDVLVQVALPSQSELFMRHLANAGMRLGVTLFRQEPVSSSEHCRKTAPVEVPYVMHSDTHCCLCSTSGRLYRKEEEAVAPLPILDGVDIPGLLDVGLVLDDHMVQFDGPANEDKDEVKEDGSDEPPFDLDEVLPLQSTSFPLVDLVEGEESTSSCTELAAWNRKHLLHEKHSQENTERSSRVGAWILDNLTTVLRLLLPLVVMGMAFYLGRS